jgi:hypothetical protein
VMRRPNFGKVLLSLRPRIFLQRLHSKTISSFHTVSTKISTFLYLFCYSIAQTSIRMALRHLNTAPKAQDFTPLQEHQEQTPSTFFGAKPVLYSHYADLTLSASASKLEEDVAFAKFKPERDGDSEDVLIKDIEIWVNSE